MSPHGALLAPISRRAKHPLFVKGDQTQSFYELRGAPLAYSGGREQLPSRAGARRCSPRPRAGAGSGELVRCLGSQDPAFRWDHRPLDNVRVGTSLPRLMQGCDAQEEDKEGAGLGVCGEVRRAERARPRRTGDWTFWGYCIIPAWTPSREPTRKCNQCPECPRSC